MVLLHFGTEPGQFVERIPDAGFARRPAGGAGAAALAGVLDGARRQFQWLARGNGQALKMDGILPCFRSRCVIIKFMGLE